MSVVVFRGLRRWAGLAALSIMLLGACRPYRLPNPTGPPQPKVRASSNPDEKSADGRSLNDQPAELKIQHNSYDKKGLLKKEKYERRRLKHKVGQRKFLGFVLPF